MATPQESNIFDVITNMIEDEYNNSQNDIGWRFLATSKKTLMSNSGIFLITLNPGGSKYNHDHPRKSCENGCAYISESWKNCPPGESGLQKQFISLFSGLAQRHPIKDKIELMESSVCGWFIPFRSSDIKLLKNKADSISLAKKIWKMVLSSTYPKLIVCIDKETYKHISEIVTNLNYDKISSIKYPTAWGNYKAEVAKYVKNGKKLSIVKFLHFSRYKIFSRKTLLDQKRSDEAIGKMLDDAMDNLFIPNEKQVKGFLSIENVTYSNAVDNAKKEIKSSKEEKEKLAPLTNARKGTMNTPGKNHTKKISQQESALKGRAWWECYSSPESMATTDKLLEIVRNVAPNCTTNYNNTEKIGLKENRKKKWFLEIEPKPVDEFIRILIMQPEDSEYVPKLKERDVKILGYNKLGQRKVRLFKNDISNNLVLIRSMLEEAYLGQK